MVTKRKHFQIHTHHQYNFLSTLTTKPNLKIVVLKYLLYLPCQLHFLFLLGVRLGPMHACFFKHQSLNEITIMFGHGWLGYSNNDHVRTWTLKTFIKNEITIIFGMLIQINVFNFWITLHVFLYTFSPICIFIYVFKHMFLIFNKCMYQTSSHQSYFTKRFNTSYSVIQPTT